MQEQHGPPKSLVTSFACHKWRALSQDNPPGKSLVYFLPDKDKFVHYSLIKL